MGENLLMLDVITASPGAYYTTTSPPHRTHPYFSREHPWIWFTLFRRINPHSTHTHTHSYSITFSFSLLSPCFRWRIQGTHGKISKTTRLLHTGNVSIYSWLPCPLLAMGTCMQKPRLGVSSWSSSSSGDW